MTDEEKIKAINEMLKRSRSSGDPIDGKEELLELREEYLKSARTAK